jgi:hypothetical protein
MGWSTGFELIRATLAFPKKTHIFQGFRSFSSYIEKGKIMEAEGDRREDW